MKKRKVSISDVARRAKVSITTVSRVINNVPTVSKKNLAKVEEAIAFLKYKPDVSAQRLARGHSSAIGLVMPGYPGIFYSFYAIEIIRGIGHACEIQKLDMVFHINNGFNPMNINSVGGLIFADVLENKKQISEALQVGIPCIVINHVVDDFDVNYLGIDNLSGSIEAVDYLVKLGHRRVATVTGNLQTQAGQQRLEGYNKVLRREKMAVRKDYVVQGDYSRRSARAAAEQLFSLPEPPTALFVASDEMALEVMSFCIERGLKVPQDVSLIGFDDNPAALYGPVSLTTVRQPLFEMAGQAVKYLNAFIQDKRKSSVQQVLSTQLVIRDSCCAPRPGSV